MTTSPPVHNGKWPPYINRRKFILVRGDVRRKADWLKALRDCQAVFHLAAYQDQRPDYSKFFEVNTYGTALLYQIIVERNLPVRKVVVASSQFVYGDGIYCCLHGSKQCFYPDLRSQEDFKSGNFEISCPHQKAARYLSFREDQIVNPTNSYGLSKRAAEMLALRLGKTCRIPTTILRYSIVQGPRQSPRNLYSGALRIFSKQALAGKPLTVYEDGRQKRDFVNIEDVVRANTLALASGRTNYQIYNVGGGKAYSVNYLAKLVQRVSQSRSEIKTGGFRSTDTRHAISDISRLKRLGWRPHFTPEKSVRDYLAWIKGENLIQ